MKANHRSRFSTGRAGICIALALAGLMVPVHGVRGQLATAQQVLANAGLPPIPEDAREVRVSAWTGTTAGVYAAMEMDRETLDAYLAALPSGVSRTSPVSFDLLIASPRGLGWFNPTKLSAGACRHRDRVYLSALERFRVYYLPGEGDAPIPVMIYYTWNFRG